MMTVGDETKPTKGPQAAEGYYGAAFAPVYNVPEDPKAPPEEEAPATEPKDEYIPPKEEDGLKTPPEYAKSIDEEMTQADMEALGLVEPTADAGAGKANSEIEAKLAKIEKGEGDLEQIAGLLAYDLSMGDVDEAQRKIALARLVAIHNSPDATDEQKGAVIHAFATIRTEGCQEMFSLAMLASIKLDDEGEELTENVKTFAMRVEEDGDESFEAAGHAAFLEAAGALAAKNPSNTKSIIDGLINLWFDKPSVKALWNALMAIADVDASFSVEAAEGKVDVTMREAVRKKFMGKYKELPEESQVVTAKNIVMAMGAEVPAAHVDIICQMIRKGPDPVRAEILGAVRELDARDGRGEIEVDRDAMMEIYAALADQAREGCFIEDEGGCEALIASIEESRRRYANLIDFSSSFSVNALSGLAGEPMDVNTGGIGFNLEWMSGEFPSGVRLLLGAHYTGWINKHQMGVAAGIAYTSGKFYAKLGAALDYLYVKDVEDGLGDVPIKLSDPQVTADGTAYRMTPHEMDFVMNAGALILRPEIGYTFHRWQLGGGQTLGLKGFVGFHAGLFVGSVYDDGCSYSYDPAGDDVIHVSPAGDWDGQIVQETELGTRCRSGKPVFGSMFGAELGLALEFGI